MSAILTTQSNFPSFLTDNLDLAFGNWNTWPDFLWKQTHKQHMTEKATVNEMETQGASLAAIQQEGSSGTSTSISQRYMTSYVPQFYSQKFKITRAAMINNRQADNLPPYVEHLRMSLDTLKNMNAMFSFNNAFSAASAGGDGEPLCSTKHPISTGFLSNTFTNGVQLNESALEDALTIIRGYKNAAGLPIQTKALKLVVPNARTYDADRILKNPNRPGTANRDIGVIYHDHSIPEGKVVNPFLVNPKNWFIVTDEMHGHKLFVREKLFFDNNGDVDAFNYTVIGIECYATGYTNWRCTFGSQGV